MAKLLLLSTTCYALVPPLQPVHTKLRAATLEEVERIPTPAFGKTFGDDVSKLKAAIFHFGATLDRGQGFNPTTGEQYKDRMDRAVSAVEALCATGTPDVTPEKLKGRWELVFSSVPHGIFRSSPFFEAIYDSYETVHESNCHGAIHPILVLLSGGRVESLPAVERGAKMEDGRL